MCRVERRQLRAAAPDAAHQGLVGVDGRDLHPLLPLRVLREQGRQSVCAHAAPPSVGSQTHERRPPPESRGGRRRGSYFFLAALTFAYFAWNLATRPAVSSTRCLPV